MIRISELRHKDVIDGADGKRLGYIRDVDINVNDGKINALIIPGENKLGLFFAKSGYEDLVIPWSKIKKVGIDVILVETDKSMPVNGKKAKNSFFFSDLAEKDDETEIKLPAKTFVNPLYEDPQ